MCEHKNTVIYTNGEDARIVAGEPVESLTTHIVCLDCGEEVEDEAVSDIDLHDIVYF